MRRRASGAERIDVRRGVLVAEIEVYNRQDRHEIDLRQGIREMIEAG